MRVASGVVLERWLCPSLVRWASREAQIGPYAEYDHKPERSATKENQTQRRTPVPRYWL
jgi:hypothetical protein